MPPALWFSFCFWDSVLLTCWAGLELKILLSPPLLNCHPRHVLPCLAILISVCRVFTLLFFNSKTWWANLKYISPSLRQKITQGSIYTSTKEKWKAFQGGIQRWTIKITGVQIHIAAFHIYISIKTHATLQWASVVLLLWYPAPLLWRII
jgi:hypothetical protein